MRAFDKGFLQSLRDAVNVIYTVVCTVAIVYIAASLYHKLEEERQRVTAGCAAPTKPVAKEKWT